MKVTKKILRRVANELEEIVDPMDDDGQPLKLFTGKPAETKKNMKEAAELLMPNDELSDDLIAVLKELGAELPEAEEEQNNEPGKQEEQKEEQIEEDNQEDESLETENMPETNTVPAPDINEGHEEWTTKDIKKMKRPELEKICENLDTDPDDFKKLKDLKIAVIDELGLYPIKEKEQEDEAAMEKPQEKEPEEAPEPESKKAKKGVIATIVECIETAPVTKQDILEKLIITFPNRQKDSMKNTINVQVPNRIRKEKNTSLTKGENDKWFFAKKSEKTGKTKK